MKEVMIESFKSANLKMEGALFLELLIEKDKVFEALVAKINSDIAEKIDQEVEILSIDLEGENALAVKGKAKAMGIQKEFTMHSIVHVDEALDLIALQVKDIDVQGGFLIQKGFELVENKIREKIESSAKIELGKTLTSLTPKINIPGTAHEIMIDIKEFKLSTLSLTPVGTDMKLKIELKKVNVDFGKNR